MSKYDPLTEKLNSIPFQEWRTTFTELERIIGFRLPKAARSYRAWWSNNDSNNVMTKAWLRAGWRTEQVDMAKEKLVFRKQKAERPEAAGGASADRPRLFGALAGTVDTMPGANIVGPTGERWHAERG